MLVGFTVGKCPATGVRSPLTTPASAPVVRRPAAGVQVAVASTAARDEVARRSTELGVDDQVEDEVDGEVGQQEEVGESRGRLERAVRAGRRLDERDDVGRSDEDREENNERNQRRRDAVCRVDRLLITAVQRLHSQPHSNRYSQPAHDIK